MKRVKLTHGSARVEEDCSKETIEALDNMSKLAYEMVSEPLNIDSVSTCFSFRYFKEGIERLMMLDNLNDETKDEYMNDWYILFKEQKHSTVAEFVEWQFPLNEVNEKTHDFWKLH